MSVSILLDRGKGVQGYNQWRQLQALMSVSILLDRGTGVQSVETATSIDVCLVFEAWGQHRQNNNNDNGNL